MTNATKPELLKTTGQRVRRLAVLVDAIWSVLQARLGLSKVELAAAMLDVDMLDGVEDGRLLTCVAPCDACGRTVDRSTRACIYCGKTAIRRAFDPPLRKAVLDYTDSIVVATPAGIAGVKPGASRSVDFQWGAFMLGVVFGATMGGLLGVSLWIPRMVAMPAKQGGLLVGGCALLVALATGVVAALVKSAMLSRANAGGEAQALHVADRGVTADESTFRQKDGGASQRQRRLHGATLRALSTRAYDLALAACAIWELFKVVAGCRDSDLRRGMRVEFAEMMGGKGAGDGDLEAEVEALHVKLRAVWELVKKQTAGEDANLDAMVIELHEGRGPSAAKVRNVPMCDRCSRPVDRWAGRCVYCDVDFEISPFDLG